ncbi:hypothetical protein BJP41_09835 [Candidatus Williamhamiltonella defendens]|uniref:Uncharacterized protein n=1 Tax=Candidatus Williamhamiltonella defendens TaxID=138072 RepID=A0A2D3T463_9ENTR|nr:hypothetical protein CJJ18_10395 [Candidatus Hamiltonella defensa]ATW30580.1 hypothetical protein BJP41_09835 [Candidatus Hamiltonella defensa]ATW34563.1 hypothetical protein BJP43_10155 [Candidatus Hamiltonella defensa]AWK17248.1 hypothetical protein CCS40_10220 [Candidatus Hamiltonella defensa]AYB49822.1 hypothetical protein CJJ19_10725 [Candidatus Hamiltonella defensa]
MYIYGITIVKKHPVDKSHFYPHFIHKIITGNPQELIFLKAMIDMAKNHLSTENSDPNNKNNKRSLNKKILLK